ncbi:hypothetical protein EOM75_00535 [Candidatus Falkowbacteria bacterium]|nr:hypothetical protein [Candidatus Falkowbacteria bacterium]
MQHIATQANDYLFPRPNPRPCPRPNTRPNPRPKPRPNPRPRPCPRPVSSLLKRRRGVFSVTSLPAGCCFLQRPKPRPVVGPWPSGPVLSNPGIIPSFLLF